MTLPVSTALAALLAFAVAQSPTGIGHRKFEYKHSFRGPNLSQRDGTVPFWDIQGDAMASSERLRLAPSMRSKRGLAVSKKPFTQAEQWIVDMSFKVTGQGRVGADGLALWYTAQPALLGPVFGAGDFWTGLAIFLDSFDNDAQRNNPYISLMVNDGTRSYDHQTDGSRQMISGCQKDFRNRPFPVKLRVEYVRNVLTLYVHDGMTQQERWELCLRAENIFLPKSGYFGLSAATGGLADDHDILSFSTYSVLSEQPKPPAFIPPEEEKKFQKEFDEQWKHFEQEKEKFAKEHPDKVKPADEDDFDKFFEDATQRELRLIYEAQNQIHQIMANLESKLDRVVQGQAQHTHTLNSIAAAKGGAVAAPAPQGGAAPAVQGASGIAQHETNELLQLSREVSGAMREMKTYINDIYSRTINMEGKIGQGGSGGGGTPGQGVGSVQAAGGYEASQIRHYLEGIKQDVEQIRVNQNRPPAANAQSGGGGCPDQGCVKSSIFFLTIAAHAALLLGFLFLRKGNDKAKFY